MLLDDFNGQGVDRVHGRNIEFAEKRKTSNAQERVEWVCEVAWAV